MAREDPQINVRLSGEENEILEAAAWVKRSRKSALAKQAVLAMIASYGKEPAVEEALASRRAEDEKG
jgi:hypothetical protein